MQPFPCAKESLESELRRLFLYATMREEKVVAIYSRTQRDQAGSTASQNSAPAFLYGIIFLWTKGGDASTQTPACKKILHKTNTKGVDLYRLPLPLC